MSILRIEVPRKFKPLLYPVRYKGAYGGRGSAKSHFFAERAILRAYENETRIVCIREVQNSIKDSVRQLLTDKIRDIGLGEYFEVTETEIRGPHYSLIIFKGMQSYNSENIKSLEAYDIAWVEEAQTLSQRSLDLLRPTIRKDGSELWFSWNPRFKTDPVDMFFRKHPPANAVSVLVNWMDNPWFPDILKQEMAHDFLIDPDKAEHIWNGAYGHTQGAILAKWIGKAEREGRVNNQVNIDPNGSPIEISSDLGFRDTAGWWYWQRKKGGYSLLKYDGDSGLDANDWIPRIQANLQGLTGQLGKIWLPPDAKAKTFQSKHSSVEKFLMAFGVSKVDIIPPSKKADQISAAREVIERCEFNQSQCESGIDGLWAWEFEWNDDNGVFSRDPVHNWASHPSDAFAYGCQVMQLYDPPKREELPLRGIAVGNPYEVTVDELWKSVPKPNQRI